MIKKILFCLAGALALTSAPTLASQTHYYYNETGYPVPIKLTILYTKPVRNKQSRELITCIPSRTTIPAPSSQMPEPWAMRRVGSECTIAKINATVVKDGQEIPATPLEYSQGFQGAGEFTVKEVPAGSNKFAVLEYKE